MHPRPDVNVIVQLGPSSLRAIAIPLHGISRIAFDCAINSIPLRPLFFKFYMDLIGHDVTQKYHGEYLRLSIIRARKQDIWRKKQVKSSDTEPLN